MPTAAPARPLAAPVRRLGRRLLGSGLLEALAAPHGVDRYLELIRPSWSLHEARAEVVEVRRQTADSVTLTLRPNENWEGFTHRAVRPPDGRDRRRAPHALLLPRLLRARARPHRDHRQGASRGPGLRLSQPSARARDGGRTVGGRRRLRPAGGPARAPAADQRRQRHHAGDVDAADALRRGTCRGRDLRPLRADARSTSSTARELGEIASASSERAGRPCLHARGRRRPHRPPQPRAPARGRPGPARAPRPTSAARPG